MIQAPISTMEKPLTVVDFIAGLSYARTPAEVATYSEQLPEHIRADERYSKAVASHLGRIKAKR